jgi:hypothetical protein
LADHQVALLISFLLAKPAHAGQTAAEGLTAHARLLSATLAHRKPLDRL